MKTLHSDRRFLVQIACFVSIHNGVRLRHLARPMFPELFEEEDDEPEMPEHEVPEPEDAHEEALPVLDRFLALRIVYGD